MQPIQIKIINKSNHALPEYATKGASGMDLRASTKTEIALKPLDRTLVNTGLYIALPQGIEAQIRPRSGLALKHGITVLNAPGTIDSDYRGEIKVLLINLSNEVFYINNGERVAQLVIATYHQTIWVPVATLAPTQRGEAGYGSTGIE